MEQKKGVTVTVDQVLESLNVERNQAETAFFKAKAGIYDLQVQQKAYETQITAAKAKIDMLNSTIRRAFDAATAIEKETKAETETKVKDE